VATPAGKGTKKRNAITATMARPMPTFLCLMTGVVSLGWIYAYSWERGSGNLAAFSFGRRTTNLPPKKVEDKEEDKEGTRVKEKRGYSPASGARIAFACSHKQLSCCREDCIQEPSVRS
jgi:hypothetical protein